MSDFSIGLSGLNAAQRSMEIIGNNIANAATEGYHKQSLDLAPKDEAYMSGVYVGQGVEVRGVTRAIDRLLEYEIKKQESMLWQASRELETLTTVENVFGELASEGLSTAMDGYYSAMHELSVDPDNSVLQNKVLVAAETLAFEFRRVGTYLSELEDQLVIEAKDKIGMLNGYAERVASLNQSILEVNVTGGDTNNMLDEREAILSAMARLGGITVQESSGMINVIVGGTPIVMGNTVSPLKVELFNDMQGQVRLGVAAEGTTNYTDELAGGEIGGLFNLRNEKISEISDKLDALAKNVIEETNRVHLQGVGSQGGFSSLMGWINTTEDLSQYTPPVTTGTIFVNITDPSGNLERYSMDVDPAVDSLSDIAAKFNTIPGMSGCSVVSGKLQLSADTNYTFDFRAGLSSDIKDPPLPAVPLTTGAGFAEPSLSGIYSGDVNQDYNFRIIGTGSVGLPGGPQVEVKNGSGQVVGRFDLGEGYVAGTTVYLENGISLAFGAGQLNDGEQFDVQALATSDTSGLLAATGINTLFTGHSATDIAVREDVAGKPERLAFSGGLNGIDNSIVLGMAKLGDTKQAVLDNLTPEQFYRGIASQVGQDVAIADVAVDNANTVMKHLVEQRDTTSGVDINAEAANLLVYQRMFQAMSQYLGKVSESLDTLINMVR